MKLSITRKIDPVSLAIYSAVSNAAKQAQTPYLVVGASARDLVLYYCYKAPITRGTRDIDFGVKLPSWESFSALKDTLVGYGFRKTNTTHRLVSQDGFYVDLVPFGELQEENATIRWPPNGDQQMSVLGFAEAHASADIVRIQEEPLLEIPVASPVGMVLLKLIAWTDRQFDKRKDDARDLHYILSSYEIIPSVTEALCKSSDLVERYQWDQRLAAAHLLGVRARAIARPDTVAAIQAIPDTKSGIRTLERLVEDACIRIDEEFHKKMPLFSALFSGFNG